VEYEAEEKAGEGWDVEGEVRWESLHSRAESPKRTIRATDHPKLGV
jgi:hypothetical protein